MTIKKSKKIYRVYGRIGRSWILFKVHKPTIKREAEKVFYNIVKSGIKARITEGWIETIERLILTQEKEEK